ncbi:MAG: 16S rRNA processing protein RimM [Ignavibacteria bacterium]|nr:16S rRNA processing protein RimM [Ignavibacteria bacterium]
MILIGRIIGTHGLKGMLKIKPFTDFSARFNKSEILCVKIENDSFEKFRIDNSFERKGIFYLKFENVNDLTQAEMLVGKDIVIEEGSLKKLESDSFYIHELIGVKVLSESGEILGVITDVFNLRSNDVYELIDNSGKKFLIPAVKDFIEEMNIESGFMKLKNTEGMFD